MIRLFQDQIERIRSAIAAAPLPWLAAGLILVGVAVAGGGFFAYRTYDYVQHDNDFCLTCHLMQDPYQRFARSAHRDLGCKACHRPTFVARSEMAMTQIIENPQELTAHADVPNRVCAECHIKGNPEEWTLIANSAGHRVHLESSDSTLQGLQCVECHSTSLHEFSATDKTCGQSGCHDKIKVQLGKMANFTIHCVACHAFTAPVPQNAGPQAALAALQPKESECLTCHAMRERVKMPPDDPHHGACGACHNPHTQKVPADAAESCTNAGCHQDPLAETPFHRGIPEEVVGNCLRCHEAHDFKVNGRNCVQCHEDVFQDRGAPGSTPSAAHQRVGLLDAPGVGWATPAASLPQQAVPPTAPGRQGVRFRHADHRGVGCLNCHSTDQSHGRVTVTSIRECRGCHHAPDQQVGCRQCHLPSEINGTHPVSRVLHFSVVSEPVKRDLPFDHAKHQSLNCGECHTGPPTLSAANVDCDKCHERHHNVETANCMSCHRAKAGGSHTLEVHATCTGSGCHASTPFDKPGVPASRNACLTCHQDKVDHRAPRNCVECHAIPGTGAGGAE